jgi:hypothetical protein
MKMLPYVVICKNRNTEQISHIVVECEFRPDAYMGVPPESDDVVYIAQTSDVEKAYTECVEWLDRYVEKVLKEGERLKVLADKVDGVLRKMMVD